MQMVVMFFEVLFWSMVILMPLVALGILLEFLD